MNSYLAILIAGLIPMVLGYVWYHPKVFGNAWMKSLGLTQEELRQGNMALIFGISIICSLVIAWRINAYSSHTQPGWSQLVHGFYHGAYSAGLVGVLMLVSNGLFQRNSLANILINAAYWLVALGLMGAFLYSVATPEPAAG